MPLWLHRLTSLMTLELDASDNLGVPPAVLRLSTADLMRFLRATEQKSIRWNTAKVRAASGPGILNAYMLVRGYVYSLDYWYKVYVCARICYLYSRAYVCIVFSHITPIHHNKHAVYQLFIFVKSK